MPLASAASVQIDSQQQLQPVCNKQSIARLVISVDIYIHDTYMKLTDGRACKCAGMVYVCLLGGWSARGMSSYIFSMHYWMDMSAQMCACMVLLSAPSPAPAFCISTH